MVIRAWRRRALVLLVAPYNVIGACVVYTRYKPGKQHFSISGCGGGCRAGNPCHSQHRTLGSIRHRVPWQLDTSTL